MLLAENILTSGIPYYSVCNVKRTIERVEISPNNYEHSQIRAFLNGLSYEYKESDSAEQTQKDEYKGIGFLQTAFTPGDQGLIENTTVDKSTASTTDKIFLLSKQEATMSDYGFAEYNASGEDNTRIRVTTDYAKATGAYQSATVGQWWLRSPHYIDENFALYIDNNGYANYSRKVNLMEFGVVPALSISLQ